MRTRPPKARRRPLITREIVEAYRRVMAPEPPLWSNRLHVAPDDSPVVIFTAPGDWPPKPPPPLALNLNVSAEVPTLETM